jgi:hydrogenase maturation protease
MIAANDKSILVIGYGSSLRGDDGVGRLIAERIADLRLPAVTTISLTEPGPEIAEQIATARAVIFADACLATEACGVSVHKVASKPLRAVSHTSAPREILGLAQLCYGRAPPAWLVAVPAEEFELSERLSRTAREHLRTAVRLILKLIDDIIQENRAEGKYGH